MPAFDQYNDPFSFESLLSLPALSTQSSSSWQALDLDEHHFHGIFKPPDTKGQVLGGLYPDFFHLQTHDVPLHEIESASASSALSDFDDTPAADNIVEKHSVEYDEDIWTLPDVTQPKISTALSSWDHFLQPSYVEPTATYPSEARPPAFDAALGQALRLVGRHIPPKIARADKLIFALFELGSGRQSGLFLWDSLNKTFQRRTGEFRLHGTSQEVHDAFTEDFIATGNTIRGLIDYIEGNAVLPAWEHLAAALSSAISVAIYATMRFLERERHSVRSLIELQELFHRPRLLFEGLTAFTKIVESGGNASETIARLTNEAQQLTSGAVWLGDILSEVTVRTATPWVSALAEVVGLSRPTILQSALRNSGSGPTDESSPTLGVSSHVLPLEISELLVECETSLQLLQAHEPEHPLFKSRDANRRPSLSWECSWEVIEELQRRADEYERSLKKAIKNCTQGSLEPEDEIEAVALEVLPPADSHVAEDLDVAEPVSLDWTTTWTKTVGTQQAMEDDKLDHLISTALVTEEDCSLALTPPLNETLNLSISPLLKAQHRLLSCSVLYLLFKRHGLQSHLRLHHQFQLLADGSFASRLSEALFDPDQSSGEGRRKGQGKTGLRLQTRDTWPPASSELRLVLMGILAESFASDSASAQQRTGPSNTQDPGLSEAMSFAIRELSDAELENCRNADSIYALDFLRLQYKPPSALLEAVLTPASQRKYDRIFKHLLRLLRMRSVVLSLIRAVSSRNCNSTSKFDHRFRVEMQFFISTLAEYSANVAIRSAWVRLEGLLDKLERCLDCSDFDGAIAIAGGLLGLTHIHDEALDSMLRALCLDRKQVQVRTLLEDIFGLILQTAAMIRRRQDMANDYDEKMYAMYKEFRKQVGRFIRYLRAQPDAPAWNGSARNGEALAFEQLLVRLNMFGYYG
jgi:hypothetical protein